MLVDFYQTDEVKQAVGRMVGGAATCATQFFFPYQEEEMTRVMRRERQRWEQLKKHTFVKETLPQLQSKLDWCCVYVAKELEYGGISSYRVRRKFALGVMIGIAAFTEDSMVRGRMYDVLGRYRAQLAREIRAGKKLLRWEEIKGPNEKEGEYECYPYHPKVEREKMAQVREKIWRERGYPKRWEKEEDVGGKCFQGSDIDWRSDREMKRSLVRFSFEGTGMMVGEDDEDDEEVTDTEEEIKDCPV